MSLPIINALRPRRDIKRTVRDTAKEIAHRASIYGVARVSLSYLSDKCGCCKQTIINHINIRNHFCEINVYIFTISWKKPTTQMCNSQNFRQNLPRQDQKLSPAITNAKFGTLAEDIAKVEKSLALYEPGSLFYTWTIQELERLKQCIKDEEKPKTS
jgi:hypothetical protein